MTGNDVVCFLLKFRERHGEPLVISTGPSHVQLLQLVAKPCLKVSLLLAFQTLYVLT